MSWKWAKSAVKKRLSRRWGVSKRVHLVCLLKLASACPISLVFTPSHTHLIHTCAKKNCPSQTSKNDKSFVVGHKHELCLNEVLNQLRVATHYGLAKVKMNDLTQMMISLMFLMIFGCMINNYRALVSNSAHSYFCQGPGIPVGEARTKDPYSSFWESQGALAWTRC